MATLPFTKMQGAGNDYVYVDAFAAPVRSLLDRQDLSALARRVSDRHCGIGSDGLIVLAVASTPDADCAMWMWNADGSRGAMCGNGLRCLAKLAFDHERVKATEFMIETDSGLRRANLTCTQDGRVVSVRTEMGKVFVEPEPRTVEALGSEWSYHAGDAGNPHAVIFVQDVATAPVVELGSILQKHPAFPRGVNVEFAHLANDSVLVQRTFERGSGETLACGTGACAVAKAGLVTGRVRGPRVKLRLRGGDLLVTCREDDSLVLEGPAVTVFEGELPLE